MEWRWGDRKSIWKCDGYDFEGIDVGRFDEGLGDFRVDAKMLRGIAFIR